MARKPNKPRPPKSDPIVDQPEDRVMSKTNSEKLLEFFKSRITFIGSIAAALVSLFTLANNWDHFNLPRMVFNSELHSVQRQVYNLEVEFRQRSKRNDQRAINELDDKITHLKNKKVDVPDELYQQKDRLNDDMKDNQEKLDRALKKLNN